MHGPMQTDEGQDAIDQRVSMKISELTQRHVAAKMLILIRITTRTVERAFARDFDGQHRRLALQDPSPGRQKSQGVHRRKGSASLMPGQNRRREGLHYS
jgi:hypothetical protein